MRSAAEILDVELAEGGCSDAWGVVDYGGVRYEGYVNVVVRAGVKEEDLSAAGAFFAGGAEEFDGAGEGMFGQDVCGCEGGGEGGGGDEVVAAGVANVWEGI